MTVLDKYQRLEAEGIWRADADAQRRDVIVAIGDATLTITDLNEVALAHWSLPAVKRLNPGERPALFSPGDDAPETLEIADETMVDALRKVLRAIRRKGAHPGRLRALITISVLATIVLLSTLWLPGALARYTAAIVPEAARKQAGADLMENVERLTGAPCLDPSGRAALREFQTRLFPSRPPTLHVLPSAVRTTQHLPGDIILISHTLVEDFETPDVLAGFILAEDLRISAQDPFERMMHDAGIIAALQLLTKGTLPDTALVRHAEKLVASTPAAVPIRQLANKFTGAQTSPIEYSEVAGLSDADQEILEENAGINDPQPLLSDSAWIALQHICES
ncbi:MAG: hypothetical protein GKR98_03055 [Boseongicola sp.]|nr:MAG: hypothetical protein GKR98_03055 [Boseongicola sp.]